MHNFWLALIDALAIAAVGIAGYSFRKIPRLTRGVGQMLEDWRGEPARPGVAARPGVMERLELHDKVLAEVLHEVKPNSGTSMRDSVAAIHQATTGLPDPGVPTDE